MSALLPLPLAGHLQLADASTARERRAEFGRRGAARREWAALEDRHQVQLHELSIACEPLRHLSPKYSPELLRMMRSEITLAKQHLYDDSNEVKRRVIIRKAVRAPLLSAA